MDLSLISVIFIIFLFFIVALLYSSVGQGGASGYLAILSLFDFFPNEMASTALVLNTFVACIAFYSFYRAGFFSFRFTLPFILTSIPFAFIGGMVNIPKIYYSAVLALVLIAASIRLTIPVSAQIAGRNVIEAPALAVALPTGGIIGFVSGVIGIGGGIFLSPLIILMKWANPKYAAATTACFIVLNSVSGILGRLIHGNFSIGNLLPYLIASILGGFIGSRWGAGKSSMIMLCRILGAVLGLAAIKLILSLF